MRRARKSACKNCWNALYKRSKAWKYKPRFQIKRMASREKRTPRRTIASRLSRRSSHIRQPVPTAVVKIRPRVMKRHGIREAVADLHLNVRTTAVIPNVWGGTTVEDVQMHLVKPTGAPEPVNQRLSRNKLLPQRSQRLNLLASAQPVISTAKSRSLPATAQPRAPGVHHQGSYPHAHVREEIPGQLGQLSVELSREAQW